MRYFLTNLSDENHSNTPVFDTEGWAIIRQKHRNLAVLPYTSCSFYSEKNSIRNISLISIESRCMYMAERNSLNVNRNILMSSDGLVTFVGLDSECWSDRLVTVVGQVSAFCRTNE